MADGIAPAEDLLLALPEPTPEIVDFSSWFGRGAPVELEIGSGKGLFLLRESGERPEVDFVGVEWARKYARSAADRLLKHRRSNVRLLAMDVRKLFGRIPTESLAAIHVYFPDPWWKRRHHKRRLMQPDFLLEALRWLRPSAKFHFATDVREYYDLTIRDFAAVDGFERQPDPEAREPMNDLDYLTHFERKYRIEGRPIHRALFLKRTS